MYFSSLKVGNPCGVVARVRFSSCHSSLLSNPIEVDGIPIEVEFDLASEVECFLMGIFFPHVLVDGLPIDIYDVSLFPFSSMEVEI